MASRTWTLALLLMAPMAAPADEPKVVTGRVVDPSGRPVAGADVSASWASNGIKWDEFVAIGSKEPEKVWRNEGKMEPWSRDRAATDADGRFSIAAPDRRKTFMVYDRERRLGAVAHFDPKHLEAPIEVRLEPLVRIFGTNRLADGEGGSLKWTCTYLDLPYDQGDPLARTRLAICGSYQSRFDFLVPPGKYDLDANSDPTTHSTRESRSIAVEAGRKEIDLGGLVLSPTVGGVQNLIDKSKARGTWTNYKQNLGKEPPPWHLTDAKGLAKDAKLSDFKGKWVLLYFWGPDCAPCLGRELPEMMAFHEAHKARRDRFEILAFCCDFSESLADIPALERRIAPVKKAIWGGKDLPFPVLLDNTFQTFERFGLEGNGVSNSLLINPEGKLVEGDLKSLEKILEQP